MAEDRIRRQIEARRKREERSHESAVLIEKIGFIPMGRAMVRPDHEFLSRSPSLGRERGLGVLLKKRRLTLTEGAWFEQHQVCLRGREILVAGIRGLAACQQNANYGNERA